MNQHQPDGEHEHLRLQRPCVLPELVGLEPIHRPSGQLTISARRTLLTISTGVVAVLATVTAVGASGRHDHQTDVGSAAPSSASDTGSVNSDQPTGSDNPILATNASPAPSPAPLSDPPNSSGAAFPAPAQTSVMDGNSAAGAPPGNPAAPPPAQPPPGAQPPPAQPPAAQPPATTPTGRALVSAESGKCLRANPADGSAVQVWSCDGSAAQQWIVVSDGTIRTGGLCLDAAWGSTTNGTGVQVARCSGNPAQRFTLNGSYDLVNVQADKCVDVTDHRTANGSPTQIWDCSGQSNQKWTLR